MKKFFLIFLTITFGCSLFLVTQAAITTIEITAEQIPDIIMNIATWFYRVVLAIAVIFVLVAAFTYLTGANNPKNIEKAHKQLFYAVIAIVVALISFGIVSLVQSLIKP